MGYIIGRCNKPLEIGPILSEFSSLFPGTEDTGDYFSNRITQQQAIARNLDMPLNAAPLESTRRAGAHLGPQPSFIIPVNDSLSFQGRLSPDSIMLNANREFGISEVKTLRDCLVSLGMELEVYGG